ncbi:uridine diphosphate-N-acetylglucosamine-binding protein YvcK [Shewanella cyperi]|uniref:Putative gluconeogenesis factor n=1 Tax=Shewanella cyperi TaxID=2814292 RepID=A0A974XNI4_9GAMM|nr:uridine diphosphate-N-acetylglucosamine-binding protein YvcK [Shewanella cyperi]QSX31656.1 uridine diphosphate-N-acetylglucosamine-binding protein YvcK [Shewanella cyperi]
MHTQHFSQYQNVVAIGGGHGLGRLLSCLDFLGSRLTGIVATTDNGGSTGRLRLEEDCIAWGDLRNCLTQLANRPSLGSLLFDYRFEGCGELNGHNLGNLILLALDKLCVRPLEAVNLIRNLLKIETRLIPMSEQPTHLVALNTSGQRVIGELQVDGMQETPLALALEPMVEATDEACQAIAAADLILLGPGSFLTSTLPALLLPRIASAVRSSNARVILIDNLTPEPSAAANLNPMQKMQWCHRLIGKEVMDSVICHSEQIYREGRCYYFPLQSKHHPGLHDRLGLIDALNLLLQQARKIA